MISDKLAEIDQSLKKQDGKTNGQVTVTKAGSINDLKVSRKKNSQGTVKSNKLQSEAESSQIVEEEEPDSEGNNDSFGCVPINNLDNETVHIKILDDEPKQQRS